MNDLKCSIKQKQIISTEVFVVKLCTPILTDLSFIMPCVVSTL